MCSFFFKPKDTSQSLMYSLYAFHMQTFKINSSYIVFFNLKFLRNYSINIKQPTNPSPKQSKKTKTKTKKNCCFNYIRAHKYSFI